MNRTTTQYPTISIIVLFAIVASLVSSRTALSVTSQCPLRIIPSRNTRSTQDAMRRRQDNKAMAAAILQKEKNAARDDDNLIAAVEANPTQVPLPSVVSPPSAPNLTSLLTGHVGQEVGNQASSDMDINSQEVNRSKTVLNLPKRRNQKR
jgi:hypothetical protein